MSEAQRIFFEIFGELPARLTPEQVGWVLNCGEHNIRALVKSKLLKPLGDPPENGEKVFSRDQLFEQIKTKGWLDKVTNCIHEYHWQKNHRRNNGSGNGARKFRPYGPDKDPPTSHRAPPGPA
jgi:hypothetical protein